MGLQNPRSMRITGEIDRVVKACTVSGQAVQRYANEFLLEYASIKLCMCCTCILCMRSLNLTCPASACMSS
jgi:hypothetical protein